VKIDKASEYHYTGPCRPWLRRRDRYTSCINHSMIEQHIRSTRHQRIVNKVFHSSLALRHGINSRHRSLFPHSPSLNTVVGVLVHAKRVLSLVHETLLGAAVHSLVLAYASSQYVCLV
jgi:hypothetical protein